MSTPEGPRITVRNNGPYLVAGVKLYDQDGNQIPAPDSFAMCRCGQSSKKPFCDGTHRTVGFEHTVVIQPA
ncbi:MAG TPA: CDGSH iron-sulfur domain-containing protein [Chloroflexota bacterium]|nr:CDGSH iron-sulfur domain-containing protein [Chloroflexota bacterium]